MTEFEAASLWTMYVQAGIAGPADVDRTDRAPASLTEGQHMHRLFTPTLLALCLAVVSARPVAAQLLLDRGANITARDKDGNLPIDYAKVNEALKGTDVYWRLHDARF